jgi:hypothetical protein
MTVDSASTIARLLSVLRVKTREAPARMFDSDWQQWQNAEAIPPHLHSLSMVEAPEFKCSTCQRDSLDSEIAPTRSFEHSFASRDFRAAPRSRAGIEAP